MLRRASRPDESFHRDQRRRRLDRSAMLESGSRGRSQPLLTRIMRKFIRLLSRR
jgi:hypothetical protein